jgi:hypothetical protein
MLVACSFCLSRYRFCALHQQKVGMSSARDKESQLSVSNAHQPTSMRQEGSRHSGGRRQRGETEAHLEFCSLRVLRCCFAGASPATEQSPCQQVSCPCLHTSATQRCAPTRASVGSSYLTQTPPPAMPPGCSCAAGHGPPSCERGHCLPRPSSCRAGCHKLWELQLLPGSWPGCCTPVDMDPPTDPEEVADCTAAYRARCLETLARGRTVPLGDTPGATPGRCTRARVAMNHEH